MRHELIGIAGENIQAGDVVYYGERGVVMKHTSPPKQYTFAEAYEMMKAGKAMRPIKNYIPQRFTKGKLQWSDGDEWNESFFFGVDEIESKWEEVNP